MHRTGRTGRAGRTGTAISLVGPKDIGSLYMLRLTYKIRPIEQQLPTPGELKTRAEADIVAMLRRGLRARAPPHPDDLALARRLLTHADAEQIVAGLLARSPRRAPPAIARRRPPRRAARRTPRPSPRRRRRRRRSPAPPSRASAIASAPSAARPASATAASRRGPSASSAPSARIGRPVASYATWEPPAEKDDDSPILPVHAAHDTEAPPPMADLPGFTESPASGVAAPTERNERFDRGERSDRGDRGDRNGGFDEEAGFAQIFVNVGRRDGASRGISSASSRGAASKRKTPGAFASATGTPSSA